MAVETFRRVAAGMVHGGESQDAALDSVLNFRRCAEILNIEVKEEVFVKAQMMLLDQ